MNNTNIDLGSFALVILVIFFWGDPDIADAIIHYLMK